MPILQVLPSGKVRWRAKWRDAEGTEQSATFDTEREARDHEIAGFYAYGLTEAQFDEMVIRQEGRCGSCSAELRNLQIDHDHVVGYNRGLLCQKCNTGGGKLGDSIEGVEAFLKYLRAAKARYQEGVEREAYDAANDG
jgi:hypothetical protein